MAFAIRVDGSIEMGIGHVLRCVTLGRKLSEYGIDCIFFTRRITNNLKNFVSKDFEVVTLDCQDPFFEAGDEYSRWLGVRQKIDAEDFISKISTKQISCVVVDHYGLDADWEKIVRNKICNLIVLDDLANRKHDCDMVIDQSIRSGVDPYEKLVPEGCSKLLGPRFALLGNLFKISPKRNTNDYSIFINFGGTDKDNFTLHVLTLLESTSIPDQLPIKIVIGKDYQFKSALEEIIKISRFKINLVQNPSNIAFEISECNFSIGAGGGSLLERSVLGVPSILYATAKNQKHICLEYQRRRLGFFLEKDDVDEVNKLNTAVQFFLNGVNLKDKARRNKDFVDVRGVDRIVAEIVKKIEHFKVRTARIDDAKFIYNCRYKNVTESFYLNASIPDLSSHVSWFSKALGSDKIRHLIYKFSNAKIGYIRLDNKTEPFEVSIYVDKIYRGRGFGLLMLDNLCKEFGQSKLRASVHLQNKPSLNSFIKCGFRILNEQNGFLQLER